MAMIAPRIALVGPTGAGKSSTGNTLCGWSTFKTSDAVESETRECSSVEFKMSWSGGRTVMAKAVDTIGLGDSDLSWREQLEKLAGYAYHAPDGVDVLLYTVAHGRFDQNMQECVSLLFEQFGGVEVQKHSVLVITRCNDPEKQFTKMQSTKVYKKLASKFEGGVVCIDNKDPVRARAEVLTKVVEVMEKNCYQRYSNEHFKEALKFREEARARIQRLPKSLQRAAFKEVDRLERGASTRAEVNEVIKEQEATARRQVWQEKQTEEANRRTAQIQAAREEDRRQAQAQAQAEERRRQGTYAARFGLTTVFTAVGSVAGPLGAGAGFLVGAGVSAMIG